MPGVALYQIADEYRTALDFDIDTEVDAEALTQLLNEVTDRFEDKAAAVVAYIRNVDAEAEAFLAEGKRILDRAKALEKRTEGLKKYLSVEMRRCNLTECKAGLSSLKFVKTPWSVEIEAGAEIPDEYLRFKPIPSPEPDKVKIAEALKEGKSIEGARLVQGERLKIS